MAKSESEAVSLCVTSYDLKKIPEMLGYYANKGCKVKTLAEVRGIELNDSKKRKTEIEHGNEKADYRPNQRDR